MEQELLKVSLELEGAKAASEGAAVLAEQLSALEARHAAAVELLGEREEALAELQADVADMKALYREQVDMLTTQLVHSASSAVPNSGVH